MNLLAFNDTHLRSSTPSCRKDSDFYQTQLRKLRQVLHLSRIHHVDYVAHGGDLFDSHDPADSLKYDVMHILNQFEAKWIVNPGNHDIAGANTKTLRRSGLGILYQAGLIETTLEPHDFDLGEVVIRCIPYQVLHEDNRKLESFFDKQPGKTYILMPHTTLTTHFVPYTHILLEEVKTNADIVICSHWHGQFLETINGTIFVNSGPLTRQTTTEAKIKPSVVLIQTGIAVRPQVMFLPIEHAQIAEAIDFTKSQEAEVEGVAESFLSTLKASALESIDRQQLIKMVGEKNNFTAATVERALIRVTEAEKTMELT